MLDTRQTPNPSSVSNAGRGSSAQAARIALIGLGGAAERILLPALRTLPNAHVVAGCDLEAAARERAARHGGVPKTYSDPGEMLKAERPDVAIVATPPLTHGELCLLALAHGCHVFCEKPFMASVEEADRVLAAASAAQRVVAVNNQYYQMPIFRRIRELLNAGKPGRLYHVGVWEHMYQLPRDEGGWKAALQPHRVLYEFATHALDLICQFFSAYPLAVSARIPKVHRGVDADMFVAMRLDFPEERVATIVINRVSRAPKKYLEMRLDCEKASLRTSLGGVVRFDLGWNSALSRPRVRFSLATGGEARWERDGRSHLLVRQPGSAFSQAAAAHFSQFLSAIRTGAEPMVSGRHAREVLRLVFAGYRSDELGGELVRL